MFLMTTTKGQSSVNSWLQGYFVELWTEKSLQVQQHKLVLVHVPIVL